MIARRIVEDGSEKSASTHEVRLREARGLIDLQMYDGAYYLAGYAVECALKTCIAKGTRRHEFPEKQKVISSHTHDLWDLVKLAKLKEAHAVEIKKRCTFPKELGFHAIMVGGESLSHACSRHCASARGSRGQ
jgi:hypothetical protein